MKYRQHLSLRPAKRKVCQITGNLRGDANTGDEFNTSITIYDTQGAPRVLNLAFTKTAHLFGLVATMDSNATPIAGAPTSISFNSDGTLQTPLNFTLAASALNAVSTSMHLIRLLLKM